MWFCRHGVSNRWDTLYFVQTVFDEVILPTHKTKYVQFLLFRMCSVDPELPAVFVNFLRLKLFNARNSIVERQAAVGVSTASECWLWCVGCVALVLVGTHCWCCIYLAPMWLCLVSVQFWEKGGEGVLSWHVIRMCTVPAGGISCELYRAA